MNSSPPLRTILTLALALVTALLASCDGDATTDGADTRLPWESGQCSFDCWPSVTCANGVVTATPGGFWDGPCDERPASCPPPSQTYTCEAGCGLPTECDESESCADSGHCDLASRCAENQPARVGDPCAEDLDCAWPCAPLGAVPERAMRCDPARGVCVADDEPPTRSSFGGSCFLDVDALATAYPNGAPERALLDEQPRCESALCLVVRDATCSHQACTITCDALGDCPADWLCEAVSTTDVASPAQVCTPLDVSPLSCAPP